MIEVWRLVRRAFCAAPADAFSGQGAALAGGRWNRKGTRVVYASATRSLAVLELLATIDRADAPTDYVFASAMLNEEDVTPLALVPPGWRSPARTQGTAEVGESFVADRTSLALVVPSTIIPQEFNYLINPLHPRAGAMRIAPSLEPFAFDERLFTL